MKNNVRTVNPTVLNEDSFHYLKPGFHVAADQRLPVSALPDLHGAAAGRGRRGRRRVVLEAGGVIKLL